MNKQNDEGGGGGGGGAAVGDVDEVKKSNLAQFTVLSSSFGTQTCRHWTVCLEDIQAFLRKRPYFQCSRRRNATVRD